MPYKYKAIIWDCDGCLVDSEYLACSHEADLLTRAGYPISVDDYIRRFCGQSGHHVWSSVAADVGFDIREKIDWEKRSQERNDLFRTHLRAIPGVQDVLTSISLPMAVASGSEYDRLNVSLGVTGFYDRLSPHIYSSSLVEHGKPAPDIFLYAADRLGVLPHDCLVIEDSENGVRAGKAAGMTVFGFTGGSHITDKDAHAQTLLGLGADLIFHHMSALQGAIALSMAPVPKGFVLAPEV